MLAGNLITLGELDRSADNLRAGLGRFLEAGDTSGLVLYLGGFAQLAHERGDDVRAMRLAGATKRLRGETGTGLVDSDDPTRPEFFSEDSYANLPPLLEAAFNAGRDLDLAAALEYATSGS